MHGPDDTRRDLREAVSTARALTTARYGITTTADEAGMGCEFVTSRFPPWKIGASPSAPTTRGGSPTCATCRGRCGSQSPQAP